MGIALMLETAALFDGLMGQKQKQTKIHCIPALEVKNLFSSPFSSFLPSLIFSTP